MSKEKDQQLLIASEGGNLEAVKKLIDEGASVHAVNKDGWTPLHFAAKKGHTDVAKALVASGALVDRSNVEGFSPITLAAQNDHPKVAALFIHELIERFKKDIKKPADDKPDKDLIDNIGTLETVFAVINQPTLSKGIGAHLRSLTQKPGGRNLRTGFLGLTDSSPKDFQKKLDGFFIANGIVDLLTISEAIGDPRPESKIEGANPVRKKSDASSASADASPASEHAPAEAASKMRRNLTGSAASAAGGFGPSQAVRAIMGSVKPKPKDRAH